MKKLIQFAALAAAMLTTSVVAPAHADDRDHVRVIWLSSHNGEIRIKIPNIACSATNDHYTLYLATSGSAQMFSLLNAALLSGKDIKLTYNQAGTCSVTGVRLYE